ncbi:MAG: hypothetical protein ACRDO2_11250 [Nocardioidaceae bacterium]
MTDAETPQAEEPGGQPSQRDPLPPSARPLLKWTVVVLVFLLVVAGAGLTAVLLLRNASSATSDGWPAEVSPFVDFVEKERDLEFTEPVPVEFLPVAEFRKEVQSEKGELTQQDRKEIKQTTGLLRAVGLIEGELDLFDAVNDLAGAGVLGYYSHEDEMIRIRGEDLTPASKATLVHELTHALQDQHFDLGARMDAFERADDKGEDTGEQTAFEALVEGDASRIESAYRDSLSEEEVDALQEEERGTSARYTKETRDIPEILTTMVGAPYALGEVMLELAIEIDGDDAVDTLFAEPPTTDEHLLDPWTLIADHDIALEVPEPDLAPGERKFDVGRFGALMWLFVLAERIPLDQALDAADGWDGDAYVGFERGGDTCVRVRYRGETARDRTQMQRALTHWRAAMPGSTASVDRVGRDLDFESCDPGATAEVGTDSSSDALGLALMRTRIAVGLVGGPGDRETTRCYADRLVHAFTINQLTDPDFDADRPAVQRTMRDLFLSCQ